MPKTNLKTKPKAIIQKKKIYFTRKNKKSNSISKGKILASKSKDKEVQIELINYSLKKSRNKSLINNKRFRTKEKSNDKSAKNKVKDVKIRNNNLNNSNKINNIKKNKENEKLNSKFLNKKRKKEKLDYDEIKQIENDEYYEEEQEKDEESIKSFSSARLEYLPCRKNEQDQIYDYNKIKNKYKNIFIYINKL